MSRLIDMSLILLAYKGKVLLMLRDFNPIALDNPVFSQENTWRFISGVKEKSKTLEESILNKVVKITGIRPQRIEFLSEGILNERKKYFYFANLTDKNVNEIQRNGQVLQFFTVRELEKLNLTVSTRMFVDSHKELLLNLGKN